MDRMRGGKERKSRKKKGERGDHGAPSYIIFVDRYSIQRLAMEERRGKGKGKTTALFILHHCFSWNARVVREKKEKEALRKRGGKGVTGAIALSGC